MKYHHSYDELTVYLTNLMPDIPKEMPELIMKHLSEPVFYREDTVVLRPGEVANLAYWPAIGYTRCYNMYKPEEDREMWKQSTIDISVPAKVTLAESSFMSQEPANFYMLIEKGSTMVSFSYESFILMGNKIPEVFILANRILANAKVDQQAQKAMSKLPRPDAYQAFLDHFGKEVESYVYQMHIASFIGMKPESLSRIRRSGGFGDEHLRR